MVELGIVVPYEGNMRKKKFKDLFDREIKIGDTVLNVWVNDQLYTHRGQGDPGPVQYRIGKVIKFTAQSIRMEYTQNKQLKDTSIYNTHNRIIVMSNNNEITNSTDSETLLKENGIKLQKVGRDLIEKTQTLNRANSKIDRMGIKIEGLEKELQDHEQYFKRFQILDL